MGIREYLTFIVLFNDKVKSVL